ncbi:MAG: hypothetical protein ACKVPY_10680 [Paracoccaceae bacterium]
MARYRTLAEWEGLTGDDALKPAERRLIDAVRAGEPCSLGDGTRPDSPDPDRTIRADLLRYLILGGCDACRTDETGVGLIGAFVAGELDLAFATARGATTLYACRFARPIRARQTGFAFFDLFLSALPSLDAQGAQVAGGVFLRGAEAEGEVSLAGATIGGQLAAVGARFRNAGGKALNAEGAQVTGDVFLRGAEAEGEVSLSGATIGGQLAAEDARFRNAGGKALNAEGAQVAGDVFLIKAEAEGEVSLSGATIGGQLAAVDARFRNAGGNALNAEGAQVAGDVFLDKAEAGGEVSLAGATIGGQLAAGDARFRNAGGKALNGQGLRVGALLWRGISECNGTLDLNGAHAGDLTDDAASWPARMILDGFTYDRIVGATNAASRLAWLAKGTRWNGTFFPQPYTQLATVLRRMGHDRAARDVLVEQARILGGEARKERRVKPNGDIDVALRAVWGDVTTPLLYLTDVTFRLVVGYGHKPWRSFFALLGLLVIATTLAHRVWDEGSFAPNSDVILASPEWRGLMAIDCVDAAPDGTPLPPLPGCIGNPAETWSAIRAIPGLDWDSFSAWGYAADLVVPVLNLGQTSAWAPSKDRGPWGYRLWWGRWVLTGLGWLVSALGIAAITGIMQRNSPG